MTELLRLHASRGGRLHMTLHEDTLYLSPRIAGVEVTQADRTEARRLGYYGPLPIHAPQ
ncbi:hypothetical protein [Deinococcus hopiensis]|nr:hypothetical protein [Deinococcus hopiensis]